MKLISIDEAIGNVVENHPDVLDTLVGLGFVHLKNPAMLKVVGKTMTIRKAAKNHKLSLATIREALLAVGFDIEEEIE